VLTSVSSGATGLNFRTHCETRERGMGELLVNGESFCVFEMSHKTAATRHVMNELIIRIRVDWYVGHLRQNFATMEILMEILISGDRCEWI